jgi:pantoate kinase
MTQLPNVTPPKWTQEQAVAFEAARECLGDVIAICIGAIAAEEKKASPDAASLDRLETELAGLLAERHSLTLTDAAAVAKVREVYGAKVRSHRERNQQQQAA